MNSAPALYAGFIVDESRNLTGIATSYNSVAQSVDLCRAGVTVQSHLSTVAKSRAITLILQNLPLTAKYLHPNTTTM